MRLWNGAIVPLLLYNGVIVRGSLSLTNDISSNEKTGFHEFLETKIAKEYSNPRVVTVVGATPDQLEQTMPLLKALPYFVVDNGKEVCVSTELAPETLVMQFLSNFDEEYIKRAMKNLNNCKQNRIMLIFEGTAVTERDMESVLRSAFQITKVPIFLNYWKSTIKLYGYGVDEKCTKRVKLILNWVPGLSTDKLGEWHANYKHEACPVVVGTPTIMPWIKFDKDESHGGVKIIGGFMGEMILAIAEKMNFTPKVNKLRIPQRTVINRADRLIKNVASGNITIGILFVRPTQEIGRVVDFSKPYLYDYHVWCVPKITKWKLNVISSEFSAITWVLVGLTFITSFVVEKIVRNVSYFNRGGAASSGSFSVIFDIIGTTLGYPIIYRPPSIGGKVLLLIYLGYSIVMTTVYKTSLASLLTVASGEQSIVHHEGIIDANLTTGGTVLGLEILEDQSAVDETTKELIKRFVIEPNSEQGLLRVSNDRDFAYLTPRSVLSFHTKRFLQTGKRVSFHLLKSHVLGHGQVIVLQKKSRFTDPINRIIQRLTENGFTMHWYTEYFITPIANSKVVGYAEVINTPESLQQLTGEKFRVILEIYCQAMGFCILVFLAELIVHKFANKR